jgi:hypothetical protein
MISGTLWTIIMSVMATMVYVFYIEEDLTNEERMFGLCLFLVLPLVGIMIERVFL